MENLILLVISFSLSIALLLAPYIVLEFVRTSKELKEAKDIEVKLKEKLIN